MKSFFLQEWINNSCQQGNKELMTFSVQPFLFIPLKNITTQDELTRMQGEILHVNIGIQTPGT